MTIEIMQPGKPTQELKERNKSLISDYVSGSFSIVDLVSKYRISSARIFKIIKRAKSREQK